MLAKSCCLLNSFLEQVFKKSCVLSIEGWHQSYSAFIPITYIQILPSSVLIASHDLSCNDEVLLQQLGSQNSEICHFWLQNLSHNSPARRRKQTNREMRLCAYGWHFHLIFFGRFVSYVGLRVWESRFYFMKQGLWNSVFELELKFSPHGMKMVLIKSGLEIRRESQWFS